MKPDYHVPSDKVWEDACRALCEALGCDSEHDSAKDLAYLAFWASIRIKRLQKELHHGHDYSAKRV